MKFLHKKTEDDLIEELRKKNNCSKYRRFKAIFDAVIETPISILLLCLFVYGVYNLENFNFKDLLIPTIFAYFAGIILVIIAMARTITSIIAAYRGNRIELMLIKYYDESKNFSNEKMKVDEK